MDASIGVDDFVGLLKHYGWIPLLLLALIGYKWILRAIGIVLIPENTLGLVNKKYVAVGKNRTLPDGKIIALNGEAGFQADTLAPGVHSFLWPWQYNIILQPFTAIEKGYIGIVEARDGKPLSGGRVLAKKVECDSYQSAREFLANGGERGSQMAVIPPGAYRINTQLFNITKCPAFDIPDNMVGIVTTKDGKSLEPGDIAGKAIDGHNAFQDAQTFIDNGGYRGLQEQVMLAGRYFINPNFAVVEAVPMTTVPIANVGVVISYVGKEGQDVTGDSFKHGNLVSIGEKGVCIEPLDPGKYPINPYTKKVECVPTANVVLNWADAKTEAHNLDRNLCTITVRSSDGFKFNLDVSQIIHIPRTDAPRVIARFGSMSNLVTQVLEPIIGNYFRNAAQGSDVIDFLKKRQTRQAEAKAAIEAALKEYNVGAVDTLIGDIVPPEALMKTLTDRKLAEQEKITFDTERLAEETRKELQQAKATADIQPQVVAAERAVAISVFNADAAIQAARGQSEAKKLNAAADAEVLTVTGAAEASKIKAIGTAESDVIKLKIESMNPENYAAIQVATALSNSGQKLVPDIIAGGSGNGTMVDVLMAQMVASNSFKADKK